MKLFKNMFKKKKIITLALAFCLTFSLTACGGSFGNIASGGAAGEHSGERA